MDLFYDWFLCIPGIPKSRTADGRGKAFHMAFGRSPFIRVSLFFSAIDQRVSPKHIMEGFSLHNSLFIGRRNQVANPPFSFFFFFLSFFFFFFLGGGTPGILNNAIYSTYLTSDRSIEL